MEVAALLNAASLDAAVAVAVVVVAAAAAVDFDVAVASWCYSRVMEAGDADDRDQDDWDAAKTAAVGAEDASRGSVVHCSCPSRQIALVSVMALRRRATGEWGHPREQVLQQ